MMTRLSLVLASLTLLVLATADQANAQIVAQGASSRFSVPAQQPVGAWLHQQLNGHGQPRKWRGPPPRYVAPEYYEYLNKRYPKFRGGFHSSYFHNMGLPPGDIGIRGNGIYPTPW